VKEMLLSTFNIPVLAYAGWFTMDSAEMVEGWLSVLTGAVVFLYTCLRLYRLYKKK